MRGVAIFVVLGLVACATADGATPASASSELREWQTPTGKPPSQAEFARSRAAWPISACAACSERRAAYNSSSGSDWMIRSGRTSQPDGSPAA